MHDRRGKAFEKGGKPLGEQQERTKQPKRFAECSQDDVRRTRHPGAQPAPSGAERAHRMGLIHHQEKPYLLRSSAIRDTSSFRTVHTEQGLRHHQRLYRGREGRKPAAVPNAHNCMGICPHIGFPQYEPSGDAGMYPAIHKDGLSSMDQRHSASEVALIAARQEQAFVKPEIRRNRLLRFFGDPLVRRPDVTPKPTAGTPRNTPDPQRAIPEMRPTQPSLSVKFRKALPPMCTTGLRPPCPAKAAAVQALGPGLPSAFHRDIRGGCVLRQPLKKPPVSRFQHIPSKVSS